MPQMTKAIELLVLATDGESAESLRLGLEELGFAVDHASDLTEAQDKFLSRGGHTVLVVAPDVGTGRAREAIHALRSVDADLQVIVFGEETLRDVTGPGLHRIKSFHPGSRAGIGAIQQIVCSLA